MGTALGGKVIPRHCFYSEKNLLEGDGEMRFVRAEITVRTNRAGELTQRTGVRLAFSVTKKWRWWRPAARKLREYAASASRCRLEPAEEFAPRGSGVAAHGSLEPIHKIASKNKPPIGAAVDGF